MTIYKVGLLEMRNAKSVFILFSGKSARARLYPVQVEVKIE